MATNKEQLKDNAQDAKDNLKENVTRLKQDLRDQATEALANGYAKAGAAKEEISKLATQAGAATKEFIDHRQSDLTHAKEKCESTIRAHPLRTAAVMFGAGYLLAKILKNK